MNEHIHELISSYLHGGNTPEQDKELFDACSSNPGTADLLKQQILLSLKLRGLREQSEVPVELRNSLLLRINELQGERERNASAATVTENVPRERERRFGWIHILGSSIATATVAGLFFMLLPDAQSPDTASLTVTDTVRVVERDTVLQTRDVLRPVYITRTVVREKKDGNPSPVDEMLPITQTPAPSDDKRLPQVIEDVTYAVVQPVREAQRQAKVSQYLEQYNAMLASVESVQLSSRDRISQ